jgi:signal transduction histidine kinase
MDHSSWIIPALVLNIFCSLLVFGLSWLVLRRHPQPFFRPWVVSEGWRALSSFSGTIFGFFWQVPPFAFLSITGMVFGSLYLVECGRSYKGEREAWPLGRTVSGAFLLAGLVLLVGWGKLPGLFFLPGFLALGISQVWIGYVFWREVPMGTGIGARVVAIGSVVFGLQSLIYPFLIALMPGVLASTTVLTALLSITVGMGMIVHLLELSNQREQDVVSQMGKTNEELVSALGELAVTRGEAQLYNEVAREQEALVRQIVHDLRNSTQAMSLILEALEEEIQSQPKAMGYVAALDRQVTFISNFLKQKLAWLVDRKSTAGRATNVQPVLEALEACFTPILAAKQQLLEIDRCLESGTLAISAVELEQLLGNLLHNAHSHCPAGTHVHLWAAFSDGWCVFYVKDNGPGIARAQQALIGRSSPRADGTRVGLRNVFELVKRAGGIFSFSSEPGAGSIFHVTLPMLSWGQEAAEHEALEMLSDPTATTRHAVPEK